MRPKKWPSLCGEIVRAGACVVEACRGLLLGPHTLHEPVAELAEHGVPNTA